MDVSGLRMVVSVLLILVVVFFPTIRRTWTKWRYTRGREAVSNRTRVERERVPDSLRWGNSYLDPKSATQHFLAVGTTGSGKSQIQKMLMKDPLKKIAIGSDNRAVIFDAKNDIASYLHHIGVTCPVLSFNPFESSQTTPIGVAWDIAKDITSPARAQNLAASLIPKEKGGNNQYFTDAARQVLIGIVESFIKHNGDDWDFSDLVYTCLSLERIQAVLSRDPLGGDGHNVLDGFFGDERTGYQVFTTIYSRMSYYRPVAALWQRAEKKLSVREWLSLESILVLGANATAKTSLDAINEQVFRVLVEEVDIQSNSARRRTWVWIDEARLAGPLIANDSLLPYLAVKGRSKGIALVLAFQDIEGLREAAGERLANELVAQLSNKALLRQESDGSAKWASAQLGQFESIEYFSSDSSSLSQSISAQRVVRDSVLASEFFQIKPASPENGLSGYFITPGGGAYRGTVPSRDVAEVVVSEVSEKIHEQVLRPESDQWMKPWSEARRQRLRLHKVLEIEKAKPTKQRRAGAKNASLDSESLPKRVPG